MRISYVVIAAFVVGCGGGSGVSIDANQDNVCGEIAEVACHNMYQCCSEGEIETFLRVSDPRTEDQCRDDLTRLCKRSIANLDDGISAGRVKFDGNIMNHCLEALVAP